MPKKLKKLGRMIDYSHILLLLMLLDIWLKLRH